VGWEKIPARLCLQLLDTLAMTHSRPRFSTIWKRLLWRADVGWQATGSGAGPCASAQTSRWLILPRGLRFLKEQLARLLEANDHPVGRACWPPSGISSMSGFWWAVNGVGKNTHPGQSWPTLAVRSGYSCLDSPPPELFRAAAVAAGHGLGRRKAAGRWIAKPAAPRPIPPPWCSMRCGPPGQGHELVLGRHGRPAARPSTT